MWTSRVNVSSTVRDFRMSTTHMSQREAVFIVLGTVWLCLGSAQGQRLCLCLSRTWTLKIRACVPCVCECVWGGEVRGHFTLYGTGLVQIQVDICDQIPGRLRSHCDIGGKQPGTKF